MPAGWRSVLWICNEAVGSLQLRLLLSDQKLPLLDPPGRLFTLISSDHVWQNLAVCQMSKCKQKTQSWEHIGRRWRHKVQNLYETKSLIVPDGAIKPEEVSEGVDHGPDTQPGEIFQQTEVCTWKIYCNNHMKKRKTGWSSETAAVRCMQQILLWFIQSHMHLSKLFNWKEINKTNSTRLKTLAQKAKRKFYKFFFLFTIFGLVI